LDGRAAALMRNHGSVAYGTDLAQAVERIELLEWLAEAYYRSASIGTPKTLTDAEMLDVVATARATGYGTPRPVDQEVR
jgi:L-fuculose-phosphate aldolase